MVLTLSQLSIALPEIVLLTMACVILLVDVFLPERLRYVTYMLVQLTLAAVFLFPAAIKEYPHPITAFSGNYG